MRAKRFVEAVKQLKFAEVLLDGDFRRVNDLYAEAIEHSEDHVLVGFRVRGPMVRIVWAAIEVIGSVADKDLPPDHSAIRGRLRGTPLRRPLAQRGANGGAG